MNRFQIGALSFVLSAATMMAGQARSLADLTKDSPLILMGRVADARSYVGDDGEVYTDVAISPDAVLKDQGRTGQRELRFTVKGGVIGDRVVAFSDAPRFEAGEDVVVFSGNEAGIEKISLDATQGGAVLNAIEKLQEDSGENVPVEEKLRARQFVNRMEHRSRRDGDGVIVLNAAACYANMGPKWPTPSTTFAAAAGLPSGWAAVLQTSAQSWSSAGSRFAFSVNASSPHTLSLAYISSPSTLASTRVEYYLSTMQIARFSMTFNDRVAWSTTGEAGKFDVQAIATHEFGHALGLTHPADSTCLDETMWASAAAGETKKRSLESGDKAGLAGLYGAATTTPAPTPTPTAPAAPAVTNFALVTTRAVATKPTTILFQGTGIDPTTVRAFLTGGFCGTTGCTATPFATSSANVVFANTLPAGTYTIAIRNGATGALSTSKTFTVNAN